MSLPADAHDEAVEEVDEAIESRSSALSDRAHSRRPGLVGATPGGGGAGSSVIAADAASTPPEGARSCCSFEPSIRAVPLPAK